MDANINGRNEGDKKMRFKATHDGNVIGWYDTLAEAEAAIAIADDPHGPEAMSAVVLGREEYFSILRKNANAD